MKHLLVIFKRHWEITHTIYFWHIAKGFVIVNCNNSWKPSDRKLKEILRHHSKQFSACFAWNEIQLVDHTEINFTFYKNERPNIFFTFLDFYLLSKFQLFFSFFNFHCGENGSLMKLLSQHPAIKKRKDSYCGIMEQKIAKTTTKYLNDFSFCLWNHLVCSNIQICVPTINLSSLGDRNQRNQIQFKPFMCFEQIFMNLLIK